MENKTSFIRSGVASEGTGGESEGRGNSCYVANANSDTVSVIATKTNKVMETIACRPENRLPFGSGCNALALNPDWMHFLYVANGSNNCVDGGAVWRREPRGRP